MILRKCSPNASHQTTDRKVEARRAVLAFVITVRGKIKNLMWLAIISQYYGHCLVDLDIAPAALFIMEPAVIANATEY